MKQRAYRPEITGLRLETLTRIRWIAIGGQSIAVLFVHFVLGFKLPLAICLFIIAASALLNAYMRLRFSASVRWRSPAIIGLLAFDLSQLAALIYFTGGLQNPFAILLSVPVVISAATQENFETFFMALLALGAASLLVFFHEPLPWYENAQLQLPLLLQIGIWVSLASTIAFAALYAFLVASEARKLAAALSATELILQREQHLSSLDGIAAAAAHELGTPLATIALVSKEMLHSLPKKSPLMEEAKLLLSQADRCREILRQLRTLSSEEDDNISLMPIDVLMEEIAAPHRNFGVEVVLTKNGKAPMPRLKRNPAILYGVGNLLENAVDFARTKVRFSADWDDKNLSFSILDDGPGFPAQAFENLGEPYFSTRGTKSKGDSTDNGNPGNGNPGNGLGLGVFIAKTLLTRAGASLVFRNEESADEPGAKNGACVEISWPRSLIEHGKEHA